jgi:glycosyltransferase involved in cell wall biosynthesis
MGQLVWRWLSAGRPYGMVVTGDPHAALAPGLLGDPSRSFFRWLFSKRLLHQTAGACAVAYVTSESLQRKYPPPPSCYCVGFSDVHLPDEAWVSAPRQARKRGDPFKLVMVGSLAHLIKAPDVLIDAIAICVRAGVNLNAVIIGDGTYRAKMETRCRSLGVGARISFTGQLASFSDVRDQLDQADLFVLPSKAEGLPRAMVEAMARALPCIGTAVGGIPELLAPEDIVAPGDAQALAQKIQEVSADPERLARMSASNLERCQFYREAEIRRVRRDYYRVLTEKTEEWLRKRSQ